MRHHHVSNKYRVQTEEEEEKEVTTSESPGVVLSLDSISFFCHNIWNYIATCNHPVSGNKHRLGRYFINTQQHPSAVFQNAQQINRSIDEQYLVSLALKIIFLWFFHWESFFQNAKESSIPLNSRFVWLVHMFSGNSSLILCCVEQQRFYKCQSSHSEQWLLSHTSEKEIQCWTIMG